MDPVKETDVKRLLEVESNICVSIYIPTISSGPETQQNPIQFKNALRRVEKDLKQRVDHRQLEKMLAPAERLLEETRFWNRQSRGLAVHISDGFFGTYRLGIPVQELVVMGKRFHLKPMLALFDARSRFYVLVLSQNMVQLLDCTPHSVSHMALPSMPADISEALSHEESEKQLQFHTGTGSSKGERAAAFHGQGVGKDDKKDQLLRYFRTVNDALMEGLKDREAPLVVACVDYLFPIYRAVNTYGHLHPEPLTGNREEDRPEDVKDQAWELVKPHFRQYQDAAVQKFRELEHTGRTSKKLREILPAAFEGRIENLLVDIEDHVWGRFDAVGNQAVLHDEEETGDEDLIDLAATETLRKGGSVYVLAAHEMPVSGKAALAVFRY